jgi:hypothetical protein
MKINFTTRMYDFQIPYMKGQVTETEWQDVVKTVKNNVDEMIVVKKDVNYILNNFNMQIEYPGITNDFIKTGVLLYLIQYKYYYDLVKEDPSRNWFIVNMFFDGEVKKGLLQRNLEI